MAGTVKYPLIPCPPGNLPATKSWSDRLPVPSPHLCCSVTARPFLTHEDPLLIGIEFKKRPDSFHHASYGFSFGTTLEKGLLIDFYA